MQVYLRPFEAQKDTVTITVGVASAATSINLATETRGNRTIRLVNSGSNIIYFTLGDSTVTTTVAAGCPMLPNTVETFLLRNEVTHIATIAGATGNSLFVTVGESS